MFKSFKNRLIEIMEVEFLVIYFLIWKKGKVMTMMSSNFEILLHFEVAIIAE